MDYIDRDKRQSVIPFAFFCVYTGIDVFHDDRL